MESLNVMRENIKQQIEKKKEIQELEQKREKVLDDMLNRHPELTYLEIWNMYTELTKIGKQINSKRQELH